MGHQIRQAISKSEIFDYIIIGSGFGGSVSALRLAEKGYRVLVLGNVQRYIAGSFYMQLVNCSGLCLFGALTSSLPVAEYLNALTGWDLSNDEYLKIGERILNLRKAFNVREGVKIEQCKLPDRALGLPPLSKGPLKGITVDIDRLQKEFFETLGWNPLTGGPTKEKIDELGIKMSAAKCED